MQFDHLMHWVPDLGIAAAAYPTLRFTVSEGVVQHPDAGTESLAWRAGAVYVELIAVCDRVAAEQSRGRAWPALNALLRKAFSADRLSRAA